MVQMLFVIIKLPVLLLLFTAVQK